MKPIIVDMKDMSDSTEVYESRPNRFLVYTIYVIFALLITAFVWMSVAKMDVVVKSNGMFRGDENVCEIGSGVTGYIEECFVENGQSVKEGDVLFSIKNESLNESIKMYEQKKEEVQKRIEILEAYQKSLDGDSSMLDGMTENPYYHEILNRKTLAGKSEGWQ